MTERHPAWIPDKEYEVVKEYTPLPHAELVFLRQGEQGLEALLFDRLTGPWKGTSCLIGGRQWKGETLEQTIARQATEIGVEAAVIPPFDPELPAFVDSSLDQDPTKQATTLTYPVAIVGGELNINTDEVSNPRWVAINNLPENIIPHHKNKILEVVERLEQFGSTVDRQ